MKRAYLYLLVDKPHSMFKIGQTLDLPERLRSLAHDWRQIDLQESYFLKDDPIAVLRLERTLHFIFCTSNITRSGRSGCTEWFDIKCLPQVLDEVKRISDYQGADRLFRRGVPKSMLRSTRTTRRKNVAEILFPKYRYRVLRLFYMNPGESHYVREVARMTNTVAGTVNRELRALHGAGLLNADNMGNQLMYSANPTSPLYDDLHRLVLKA